jgi:hypothetical protein
MRRVVAAIGLLLMSCTPGDPGSSKASPAATPVAAAADAAVAPRLVGASLAYDTERSQLVMFGTWYWPSEFSTGMTQPASPTAETWTWRSGKWTKLAPAASPPPRTWGGMAYDQAHRQIVLFGGGGRGTVATLQDTWIWDGNTWSQRNPVTKPPVSALPVLVYHAKLGRVVALVDVPGEVAQTWTWDGNSWTRLRPSIELEAGLFGESAASAAYDATHQAIVVFGRSRDTWTFDGTSWARTVPALVGPSARQGSTMAYDPSTGKVVMFGGYGETALDDTWTWDGARWTQSAAADRPTARAFARAATDATAGDIFVYGGISFAPGIALNHFDVWTWAHGSWTLAQPSTIPAPLIERNAILDAASFGLRNSCSGGSPPCMSARGGPQLGFYAGYVLFDLNPADGQNALCVSYVSYVKAGDGNFASGPWHQVGVACGPVNANMPRIGAKAQVAVRGCANVRTLPQVGTVVSCLPNGTTVTIDDGPVAIAGDSNRLWWHLQQRGWMAHELLATG